MRNRASHLVAIAATVGVFLAAAPAVAELTDQSSHPPTSYYSFLPPGEGSSYVDPVFDTSVKRLTDSLGTPNATGDSSFLTWTMNEYATVAAFNSDDSRFLLQHDSYFALYDGSGNYLRDLPFEIHAGAQPRWSRSSNNVLYFINGNRVKSYNVSTGATSTVRTFSEYGSISGHGESDISFSGNKLVLAGDSTAIFVYNIDSNSKSAVFSTAGKGTWDFIQITPDGNVLLAWHASGAGRYRGMELFNGNMTFLRQISTVIGHGDVTRDTSGAELFVYANANDPTPVCDNGVIKVRLSDAAETCMISLNWNLAVHVSCPDGNGSCIVSTYVPSDPNPNQSWPSYSNEILRVPLDGSVTRRLAHHRSRPMNDYNWTPRASVSRDGKRVVYASNFGLQDSLGLPTEYSDAYLIQLAGGTQTPPPPSGLIFQADFNGSVGMSEWTTAKKN